MESRTVLLGALYSSLLTQAWFLDRPKFFISREACRTTLHDSSHIRKTSKTGQDSVK